jgi:hypothetical protein
MHNAESRMRNAAMQQQQESRGTVPICFTENGIVEQKKIRNGKMKEISRFMEIN